MIPQTEKFEIPWIVPSDLPCFEGHFPSNPVLPGVAIIDKSLEALQILTKNSGLRLSKIKSAKFLAPIGPYEKILLKVEKTASQEWTVQWKSNEKLVASLCFTF